MYYERERDYMYVPGRGGGDQESCSSRGNKELLKNIINSVVCNDRVLGVVWFILKCLLVNSITCNYLFVTILK